VSVSAFWHAKMGVFLGDNVNLMLAWWTVKAAWCSIGEHLLECHSPHQKYLRGCHSPALPTTTPLNKSRHLTNTSATSCVHIAVPSAGSLLGLCCYLTGLQSGWCMLQHLIYTSWQSRSIFTKNF